MKKLLVLFTALALVCSVVPAMAVDWNFYGSARMATYYTEQSGPFNRENGGANQDTNELGWDLQGNSRLGATVKHEGPVTGRFEFGINENTVTSRRIFGTWDFGAAKLTVGKDYTPVSQFVSGQAFSGDLGLLGTGTFYGARNGQIRLDFGGFSFAAIRQNPSALGSGGNTERWIPRLEASYSMPLDNFSFQLMGGYSYYKVKDPTAGTDPDDFDVQSWMLGADVTTSFGPLGLFFAGSYSVNPAQAGWYLNVQGDSTGAANSVGFNASTNNKGDDIKDVAFSQLSGGASFAFSDTVRLEAGYGWWYADSDADGAGSESGWTAYGQAMFTMAPGVYLVPEVGYFDYGNDSGQRGNKSLGSKFYAGAKWQIDF